MKKIEITNREEFRANFVTCEHWHCERVWDVDFGPGQPVRRIKIFDLESERYFADSLFGRYFSLKYKPTTITLRKADDWYTMCVEQDNIGKVTFTSIDC